MKLAIPLTPPSLDEALAFADQLRARSDVADGPPMTDEQLDRAKTAAASHVDCNALAALVRAQLVPTLGRALVGLARVLRFVSDIGPAPGMAVSEREVELTELAGTTQYDMKRAGEATTAAEMCSALLTGHAVPAIAPTDAIDRVGAKVTEYLRQRVKDSGVYETVAEDLTLALRELTGPARAAVDAIDADQLDDLLSYPLQQQLFETFLAISAVHTYLATLQSLHATTTHMQANGPR